MKIRIGCVTVLLMLVMFCGRSALALQGQDKPLQPNVLWLTAEDIGPQLACYGDDTAKTPRLDALAAQGLTYDTAWSNYPVCGPARTTIITGMYAGSLGAGNMRSLAKLPANVKMFPQYLREAGYYCANNGKEDYNLVTPEGVWDRSSNKADWRNRKPGQPFFAVINHGGTHESKIRNRPHKAITDPASVTLAPYWPDVPEVRQDWAQYYDNFVRMDKWIEKELQKLEDEGVADNTIVFFFGDHGSGMPRHKRFAGDSGMRVPFVVHVPEKLRADFAPQDYSPGGRSERPIGFVDLAPTMLSVAGIDAPDYMQGQAFLGRKQVASESDYLFGFRERMDARQDLSYSVRDKRFVYIRNFMPYLPAGQNMEYQMKTPATRKWFEMFKAGKLNAVQSSFWEPRASEELYDLKADPFETKNLAGDPQHQTTLEKFRAEFKKNTLKIRDLGLVHEGRLQMITAAGKQTRRDFALDPASYPLEEIFKIAGSVGRQETKFESMIGLLSFVKAGVSDNPIVRYWAAMGMLNHGKSAVQELGDEMKPWLDDAAPEVALTAAEAFIKYSEDDATIAKAKQVVVKYCDFNNSNSYYALTAVNIVDRHLKIFEKELPAILALPKDDPSITRGGGYIERIFGSIKAQMNK